MTSNVDGQMLGDGTYQYQWDERGRLSGITQGGSTVATFQYDAFGRRVGKTVSGINTNFLHDGWQIVQEKNGATVKANVLAGPRLDHVLRRIESGQTMTFLADALGSSVALVGTSGIATSYKFGPYGMTSTTGATSNNAYQYTGRENDGPLYYYRNRYYHPQFGRFVSEDPLGLAAGQNVYAYVNGNPIRYIDPLGLLGCPGGFPEQACEDEDRRARAEQEAAEAQANCDPEEERRQNERENEANRRYMEHTNTPLPDYTNADPAGDPLPDPMPPREPLSERPPSTPPPQPECSTCNLGF